MVWPGDKNHFLLPPKNGILKDCQFAFVIYIVREIRCLIDSPKMGLIELSYCIIFDMSALFFFYFWMKEILTFQKKKKKKPHLNFLFANAYKPKGWALSNQKLQGLSDQNFILTHLIYITYNDSLRYNWSFPATFQIN